MSEVSTAFQISQDLSLLDEEFLVALSEQRYRDIYARVIALDVNELPIEQLEGRVTGGNINIDGDSAIRRTCSLTMVVDEVSIGDFYWGLKTKIALYIGIRNKIVDLKYTTYPDIVWFPQGIYILTSFNTSLQANSCTISLQGKDKMCLLNGEMGGQLFASVDFGTEEVVRKIFKKADIFQTSSDLLMVEDQKYYTDVITSFPEYVDEQDDAYSFELCKTIEQNQPYYYKDRNRYIQVQGNALSGIDKYKIYKQVQSPEELFNLVGQVTSSVFSNGSPYEAGKYYYEKKVTNNSEEIIGDKFYIVDNSSSYTADRDYYALKQLYIVDYETTIEKIPIEKIIREAVHAYAQEPYHNIIINDLDNYGLEQMTYLGDDPIYALRDASTRHFTQLIREGDNSSLVGAISGWQEGQFDSLTSDLIDYNSYGRVYIDSNREFQNFDNQFNIDDVDKKTFTVAKITNGMDIGYRVTDLVYAGDLITGIGDSLTSVFDKIKSMLGDFEYFYDLDGHFVFQRKKNYVNTSWSQLNSGNQQDEQYVTFYYDKKKFSYNFEGNRIISSIQNTPVLSNVRNDFSVWGVRKGINNSDVPIHARYAIDKKPKIYLAFNGKLYYTNEASEADKSIFSVSVGVAPTPIEVDWRELIYQMAIDYLAGQGCSQQDPIRIYSLQEKNFIILSSPDLFLTYVGENNPDYYYTGYTGYEQYYTDLQGFWRQLYNPEYEPVPIYNAGYYTTENVALGNSNYWTRAKVWHPGVVDYQVDYYLQKAAQGQVQTEAEQTNPNSYVNEGDIKLFWNKMVFESPETLNFWFEFLDSQSELAQFSVSQLGDRSKVVNETKASSIIFKDIPDIILCPRKTYNSSLQYDENYQYNGWKCDLSELRAELQEETGYTFVFFPPGFAKYFSISYRSLSVKDKIDELLYQHAYCVENISITALPVYYLQPNTRIYVHDETTKIDGEYLVSKISLPLTFNGTMSISAVKAPERLY